MKKLNLILPVLLLLSVGCVVPRVPETVITTPFGLDFRGPKDMELEIDGLQYQRSTNGTVVLTAKMVRTKSRNNPAAIDASTDQIREHWSGIKAVAGELVEKAAAGAVGKPK